MEKQTRFDWVFHVVKLASDDCLYYETSDFRFYPDVDDTKMDVDFDSREGLLPKQQFIDMVETYGKVKIVNRRFDRSNC